MLPADCRCTNLSKGNFPTYVNRRGAIGIAGGAGGGWGGLEIFRILIGEWGGGGSNSRGVGKFFKILIAGMG